MKAWRMLIALSFLLLTGCLVTFPDPLPATQAAPAALLGKWYSKDAWGDHVNLQITHTGQHHYRASSRAVEPTDDDTGKKRVSLDRVDFTVSRHGNRWYASAAMPQAYGGRYAIAGFELTEEGELVIYNLDVDQIKQALARKTLQGEVYEADKNQGVLVASPQAQVFAYLDDPANSDVFVEIARYRRAK